jgi:hypothetical protein
MQLIMTVDAYSGSLLFIAFMAEMRHPLDFWKGMILAQAFICFVYVIFGAYVNTRSFLLMFSLFDHQANLFLQVYSNFGQYAISNINQAIQPYKLQTVTNVLSLLTGCIALGMWPLAQIFHESSMLIGYCQFSTLILA